MQQDLIAEFIALVGAKNAMTNASDHAPFLQDLRGLYKSHTPLVLKPENTQEVAAILALAYARNVQIVPQGGATGLVGGHIPNGEDQIILSLTRMVKLREADSAGQYLSVDAGITLLNLQQEAAKIGRFFPLSLPSEGSCTIGGNLSTNAGGTAVLAYGNTRDLVLGLEVVLADGRILNMMRILKKDNTGYDLRHLFMGAEGTLGVITGVVVKLFPAIHTRETAFIGLATPHHALRLLSRLETQGNLTTFELMPHFGLETVLKHGVDVRAPLPTKHEWYALVELSSPAKLDLRTLLETSLSDALEAGEIDNAALADSVTQANAFWRLRELMSETQGREGGSIKHDVSVPVADVPVFLDTVLAALHAAYPTARPLPFGHMGDGNIHFNLSQPIGADKETFLATWGEVNALVHGITTQFKGSISAEHGIGQLKRDHLPHVKDPVTYALMEEMKAMLDPKGLLNPNKVLKSKAV
jgi:FAD/FMN-containing dehydrogenase